LDDDQKDYSRWQADQDITNQENALKDKIQSAQDVKDAQTRAYNNQKDAFDQSIQSQTNTLDVQKQAIADQQAAISDKQQSISDQKSAIDNKKNDIQNQKSNLDNQKNEIATKQNSINDSRNSLDGYATGTENATPGPKQLAENGIEIVVGHQVRNFVGGEKVLNNAQTMSLLNGKSKSNNASSQTNSNVSVNVLNNSDKQAKQTKQILDAIGTAVISNKQLVKEPANQLISEVDDTVSKFVDQSPKYSKDTSKNIGTGIIDNKQLITKPMDAVIQEIKNQCQQFVDGSGQYAKNSNNNIGISITNTAESVYNPTRTLIGNVKKLLDDFVKSMHDEGKGLDGQLGQGILDGHDDLMKTIDTISKNMIDQFNKDLDIHSPSKEMYKIGQFMIQGLINGMSESDIEKFISDKIGGMTGAINSQVANVPGSVTDWIKQAMKLTGVSDSWLPALQTIAMHESGGDPNNINTYDSNAIAGHPSQGLMQTIPSTFSENMIAGHNNILNPIDNTVAAINYIKKRYGDVNNVPGIRALARGGSYIGYQKGTDYVPKTGIYNINEETREGAETVLLPQGTGVVNGNNTHNLNVLAENAPSLVDALRDDIQSNNIVQDMYSK
jgi:SLT domain-containing protein